MPQMKFASYIGMSPASLSSIFNDRTRPTLNTVEAIKNKIPNVNTDWLLFGKGSMFVEDTPTPEDTPSPDSGGERDLFSAGMSSGTSVRNNTSYNKRPSGDRRQEGLLDFDGGSDRDSAKITEVKYIDRPQRKITEIRVFFDDQTFVTFAPKE